MIPAAELYPRDLRGYAGKPPHAQWPNQARIAVQFVLNYEEGAENHVLHGDAGSEQFLSDIIGAASYPDRHMSMDSLYEYGSRAGFWRIHHAFQERGLPLTVFGVAMALARHPDIVAAIKAANYDVVSHGWRWIHYQHMAIEQERDHLHKAVQVLTDLFGKPAGTQGAIALTPGNWWSNMADLITTATIMAMICRSGRKCLAPTGSVNRISSCLTRSMPTICALPPLRGLIPLNSFIPI